MRFGLLGPLELSGHEGPVTIDDPRHRSLLALLLIHANEVVSKDQLIAAAWGGQPSPRERLSEMMARLGDKLGSCAGSELLVARGDGYLLRVAPDELDITRFERALADGRGALAAGEFVRAAETLRLAESMWRGEALTDFAHEPFAREEIARLERLRRAAVEARVEAEGRLGQATGSVRGSTLGAYRLDSVVGRGGMGVVYRATDLSLDRCVAVKVIAPEFADDRRFRERFLRESRIAASLEHPHVLPIYEASLSSRSVFIAMRYVEGNDLGTVLREEHRLPASEALSICGQVAGALDAAAAKGLVHRDVKPANVLLDETGNAYLVDFGLAKQATGTTTLTEAGTLMGTLDYLAPEQIRGEQLDGRTDQYALACSLVECLTGAPPFRRATEVETLWAHMQEDPPRLVEFPVLDPVLRRGLAKAREDRYDTCAELIAEAAAALEQDGSIKRRSAFLDRVAGQSPARRAAVLMSLAALLLGAAAVAAISQRGGPQARSAPPALDIGPNSVAIVDASTGTVRSALPLSGRPTDLAVGDRTLWASTVNSSSLTGVDTRTRTIARAVPLPIAPSALAVGDGAVWIADGRRGVLVTVAEGYENVSPLIRFRRGRAPSGGRDATSVVVGSGGVWVTDGSSRLARVDSRTHRVTAIATGGALVDLTVAHGAVWAVSAHPPRVVRVDPATNRVTDRLPIARAGDEAPQPVGIAASENAVWVLNANTATVTRIDPRARGIVGTTIIGVDRVPNGIAAGGRSAWVANEDGSLARLDEAASAASSVHVGESLREVAVQGRSLWIATVAIDQQMPGGAG